MGKGYFKGVGCRFLAGLLTGVFGGSSKGSVEGSYKELGRQVYIRACC